MTINLDSRSFTATFYRSGGHHPATLVVIGSVQVPTPGWDIRLRVAPNQGINSRVLMLAFEATAPTGTVPQHVETDTVSLATHARAHEYNQVNIQNPYGEGIIIDVEQA